MDQLGNLIALRAHVFRLDIGVLRWTLMWMWRAGSYGYRTLAEAIP